MLGYMLGRAISRADTSMAEAGIRSMAAQKSIEFQFLERRIESLELACAGLWTLLKEQHGYTDEALVEAVREVDLRDGVEDGKISGSTEVCPECNRKMLTRKSPNCSWCGADLARSPL